MATGMLISAAVSAGTQIYSGVQAKKAAEANADLVLEQAEEAKAQAFDQASMLGRQGQSFIASQRAGAAASGVKAGVGSPLAALRESETNLREDVSRVRAGGETALRRGQNLASQSRKSGQDIFAASLFGAGSSFLTNVASGYQEGPYKDLFKSWFGKKQPLNQLGFRS